MNYKIVIIDDAKAEYRKSFDWYKDINPILAKRFYSSFKESLAIIKENPLLFQIRYDDVRIVVFSTFPYLIHYRIHKNRIVIESICHSSKDGKLNVF
jgi:ParE toxin of type II toxin-antitoxin system, parDE